MTIEEQSTVRNQQLKEYIEEIFSPLDPILEQIQLHSKNMGLPEIQVPAHVGKLLYLLAKTQTAHRILEIGTLGAYSTIWLAKALPLNGTLISLEINPLYAQLARVHLRDAELDQQVSILEGDAAGILPLLIEKQEPPFDLIFIDADKERNQTYLEYALKLSRSGTLILIDNLIPKGEEIGVPNSHQASSVYRFNQYLAHHPQLETILIPSITGQKGRLDCLGMARVR